MARVVASLPLAGPTAEAGEAAAAAMRLACEDLGSALDLEFLDAGAGPFGEHVEANARRAAADADVVAYVGEFHSAATELSLPLLEAAGLPQVGFSNTLRRLVGRSFVCVMPHDERLAAALVEWMAELGVRRPFLLDDGDDYGIDMRWLVHAALSARDVRVAGGARLHDMGIEDVDLGEADAVFLGGLTHTLAGTADALRDRAPELPLFALEGMEGLAGSAGMHVVLGARLPSQLPEAGRAVMERLGADADRHAVYAYEAMALLIHAAGTAGADRGALAAALRATRERDSVLGRYSFDARGATTLAAAGRVGPSSSS